MKLKKMTGSYSVARYPKDFSPPEINSSFYSVTKTLEELSIVCEKETVPSGFLKKEDGWAALMVEGPLDFSMTGVISSISSPLAESEISLFTISTFDTDYILLKEEVFAKAISVLEEAGFKLEEAHV